MVEVTENQGETGIRSGQLPARQPVFQPPSRSSVPRPTASGFKDPLAAVSRRVRGYVRDRLTEEISHGHFFLFVPVCVGGGAAIWFSLPSPPSALALVPLVLGLLVALSRSTRDTAFHVILWSACLAAVGMLLAESLTRRVSTVIIDQPLVTTVTGLVERREQGAAGEWRYTLRLTGTVEPTVRRPPERVSLLARSKHAPAAIGDWLSGRARLSPPSGPALPGLNDFAFQSYFSGIGAVGFFLGPPQAKMAGPDDGEGLVARFDAALFSLRDRISNRIRSVLPGDPGAFAASIITGERRSMSTAATEALRVSGLAHITAISGLNMALAAGIFFVGLRGLLSLVPALAERYPIKKMAAVGALMATTGYVLISGYQVSALRAYLMTAIMLVAVLFDRPAVSLRNLALAATAILAVQPSAVMGPSFQMSFAATAGLIAGYAGWRSRPRAFLPPMRSSLLRIAAGGGKLVGGTLATSLIGGLATAIFAITHFHRLSTHGLEANLAAMPLISLVVMPAGFIAMLLMPLGLDGPFFWIMGQGLELVLYVAYVVSGWGGGYVFPRLPDWFMLGTITGMLMLTLFRSSLRHVGTVLIAVTLPATWLAPRQEAGELMISEDARLVALWTGDGAARTLTINRTRPPAFIFDQWRPVLAVETTMPPLMLAIGELPAPPDWRTGETWSAAQRSAAGTLLDQLAQSARMNRFTCIKQACVVRMETGKLLMTLDRPDLVGTGCDLADIIVLAARTRLTACRSGAALLSQSSLRATGAVEISGLADPPQHLAIRTSFEGKPRPWTAHRLYDWRTASAADEHTIPQTSESRTVAQPPSPAGEAQ